MAKNYQIVSSDEGGLINLERRVDNLIKEGWQPIGGVSIIIREVNRKGNFVEKGGKKIVVGYQAMILKTELVSKTQ
ncbi:MAG TPA: hypothetical protein VGI82_05885 [Chitinophagaceae bacterium]|jgi:hypothetical protein